jgi:uncharacterized protein GlcG (DUF336 family)/NAD-dependent dihydropyrimidine dehydrogenase PreA subunit
VTYVIAEPCIGEKNGACVDVCPAACIHTTPDAPQNYIDPDVCIECEQCVLVCPVNAVFLDKELPEEWRSFIDVNAAFFRANRPVGDLRLEVARSMLEAVVDYAARANLQVGVAIVDHEGAILASGGQWALLDQAEKKAYTALMYGVATHELKPNGRPLWRDVAEINSDRVLVSPGGYPVVEGVYTLGAVGVAGAGPDQDMLCCQAALVSRLSHQGL